MKLLLDIGNTAAKIAVANAGELIHTEHLTPSWRDTISRLLHIYPIQECRISSVAAEDETLAETLRLHNLPTLWLDETTPCTLKRIPKGYGPDRMAADIGALAQSAGHTLLTIDAGTCITYDLIDKDGTILGGIISPGIQLRLRAMHEHTARLPLLTPDNNTPLIGTDTHTAMMSAAIHGTRLEAEGYILKLARQYNDLIVYTTGGNALQLSDDIPVKVIHDPLLIFKGLASIDTAS